VIAEVTQSSQYLAVVFGIGVCISACAGLSTRPRQTLFLTCEPLTYNVRGDIDPVPSPDGRYIAYRAMTDESPELGELRYLRLDYASEPHTLLRAGEFHGGASWAPDNEWISYTVFERADTQSIFVVDSVYKVNIRTQQKVRLVDGRTFPNIGEYTTWTAKNKIVFATPDALYQVDVDGGTPNKKLSLDTTFTELPLHLAAAPDGKSIAFSVDTRDSDDKTLRYRSGIWLADIDDGRLVQLTFGSRDSFPTWQNDETIMFLRETTRPKVYSLQLLSLATGKIFPVAHQGVVFSIAQLPYRNVVFAATTPKWDLSGNDFNFFRGFSISRCENRKSGSGKSGKSKARGQVYH
jgi:dipeptidyl aminopeptidase/acylaminoacyl peptidase